MRRFLVAFVLAAAAATAALADPATPLAPAERAALVQALKDAEEVGQPSTGALDDATLWTRAIRFAAAELGQRVRPTEIDGRWAIAPGPRNVETELIAARDAGRLAEWLSALRPADPRYRALVAARVRYAAMVAQGGWAPQPSGGVLALDATGPAVAALRTRLAVEGYLPTPATAEAATSFDAALLQALTGFQAAHGLDPDGRLGPATRAALDVPADERLAAIDANLERWRWLPPLPVRRMEVDIAGAVAALHQPGATPLEMRVIVGDLKHHTPMFASQLETVVFNPPWNVPASIASQELMPKEAARPGYLARNGFIFTQSGLQQRPGPGNALGRIKFDLPSPFGVYLHDTPNHAAFSRPRRALSHGCIRLDLPRELAEALLADQGWTLRRIDAAIAAADTRRVALSRPVPLYVVYWTAIADAAGRVRFQPDVYGWDARLTRALAANAG